MTMTMTAILEQRSATTSKFFGKDRELAAKASRWKAYLRERIIPELAAEVFLQGRVAPARRTTPPRWVCIEPDPLEALEIEHEVEAGVLPRFCEVHAGTLMDIADDPFDMVLYIDVLEHLDDDHAELDRAAEHLNPGGKLVVLSPAQTWGHLGLDLTDGPLRRYNKATLRAIRPHGINLQRLEYLDAVGLFDRLADRFLIRHPAYGHDSTCRESSAEWGKSVLGIWVKPGL